MEECSVLIETTKLAEDKTSRWFDLPIDYELFRDLLGVEADSNDYQIIDMKLPFAGDIVRSTLFPWAMMKSTVMRRWKNCWKTKSPVDSKSADWKPKILPI